MAFKVVDVGLDKTLAMVFFVKKADLCALLIRQIAYSPPPYEPDLPRLVSHVAIDRDHCARWICE